MANKYKIIFSKQANSQMEEIFDFIKYSLCSPDSATNLALHLREKINSLSYLPKRNLVCCEINGIKLRRIIVDNFYVYYSIKRENVVLVMMILYKRRDQVACLRDIK